MSELPAMLPPPSPEHRRAAAAQFERANQVIMAGGFEYAIQLLMACCRLDPANLIYRRQLRDTQKIRWGHNHRGSRFAFLTNLRAKVRLRAAAREHDYVRVLELGEGILNRNPWDIATKLDLADAARKLDLIDVAIWLLEEARQAKPLHRAVNRRLAWLYERCGRFHEAHELWELVVQANPGDGEARQRLDEATELLQRASSEGREVGQWHAAETDARKTPIPDDAASFEAAIERDPTNVESHLLLARFHRNAGDWEHARAVVQQGLGPTARAFELISELADLEIDPFRQNLAIVTARLEKAPDDPALRDLRESLWKEISTREAEIYRARSERQPRDLLLRLELGLRLLRLNQGDEAQEELEEARRDPEIGWRAAFYLGHFHRSRNDWPRAEECFEEALVRLPASAAALHREISFVLAVGAAEAGDFAKAIDIGQGLQALEPDYRGIQALLADWHAKLPTADRLNG